MSRESHCILRHTHFKIIKRARQNYLFDQWKASNPSKEAIIELAKNGIARFQKKHDEEEDQDKKKMYFDHLTKANAAVQGKFIEKNIYTINKTLFTRDTLKHPKEYYKDFTNAIDTIFERIRSNILQRRFTDFIIY